MNVGVWLSMFNAIIGTFFYQRWIILEIIRGRIMVFVTTAHGRICLHSQETKLPLEYQRNV